MSTVVKRMLALIALVLLAAGFVLAAKHPVRHVPDQTGGPGATYQPFPAAGATRGLVLDGLAEACYSVLVPGIVKTFIWWIVIIVAGIAVVAWVLSNPGQAGHDVHHTVAGIWDFFFSSAKG